MARAKRKNDGMPDVYRELMHEAGESSRTADTDGDETRPRKRPRRAGERLAHVAETSQPAVQVESSPPPPPLPTQTTIDESESELEFEDVELIGSAAEATDDDALPDRAREQEEGFTVTVQKTGADTPARARRKRRPVTSAERSVRLAVHKMHVCYLLYHVFYRNHWCSDEVAQVC